jgi:hypothetical protein
MPQYCGCRQPNFCPAFKKLKKKPIEKMGADWKERPQNRRSSVRPGLPSTNPKAPDGWQSSLQRCVKLSGKKRLH